MSHVSAINCIEVPEGYEETALEIRNHYVEYFKEQPGFVSSAFYKSVTSHNRINYINIVVWDSQESYDSVVNIGFQDIDGVNKDGMKVLGKGFPEPIVVNPGVFKIIQSD